MIPKEFIFNILQSSIIEISLFNLVLLTFMAYMIHNIMFYTLNTYKIIVHSCFIKKRNAKTYCQFDWSGGDLQTGQGKSGKCQRNRKLNSVETLDKYLWFILEV